MPKTYSDSVVNNHTNPQYHPFDDTSLIKDVPWPQVNDAAKCHVKALPARLDTADVTCDVLEQVVLRDIGPPCYAHV